MLLKGAVAVLTGSGRVNGVGAATARLLAQKGCRILINCVSSEDQAAQVLDECRKEGAEAEVFMADLTSAASCQHMAQYAQQRFGGTDILVNCLGATKGAPYEQLDKLGAEDFAHLYAVNATAPYLVAQAFQPLLRARKVLPTAALINVTSAAGITGKGSSIAYASAKGAANTLTLALAQALSPEVRVNAVCPSFIDSSWWEQTFAGREADYEKLRNSMAANTLLGRVLTPEDVARTIVSIIENPVMSGELIRLDAGAHIGKGNPR